MKSRLRAFQRCQTGNFKNLKRKIKNEKFDVIMAHDVFEHFHSSPRIVLNHLLSNLKTEGYLIISVPNAANLRKRISIFASFDAFFSG